MAKTAVAPTLSPVVLGSGRGVWGSDAEQVAEGLNYAFSERPMTHLAMAVGPNGWQANAVGTLNHAFPTTSGWREILRFRMRIDVDTQDIIVGAECYVPSGNQVQVRFTIGAASAVTLTTFTDASSGETESTVATADSGTGWVTCVVEGNHSSGSASTAYVRSVRVQDQVLASLPSPLDDYTAPPVPYQAAYLTFDGVNDYVDCGNNAALNKGAAMTLALWMRAASYGTSDVPTGKWITGGNLEWRLFDGATNMSFYISDNGSTSNVRGYFSNSVFSSNTWHHVAIVYDGSGSTNPDKLKIYVDGSPQSLTFAGTIPTSMYAGSANLVLGAQNTSATNIWTGDLSNVLIFNVALTSGEVSELINVDEPTDPADHSQSAALDNAWSTDLASMSYPTVTDEGTDGQDGTMTNMDAGDIVDGPLNP